MIALLLLACLGVTVGPGWSDPILVTDSTNTSAPFQLLERDNRGRFHLIWEGFSEAQIGYKMFSLDGTTLYPETMISRNVNSFYLSTATLGDSLYAFWREYDPVYTSARSLTDGSELLSATHLFTTYTWIPEIRSSPDSLGRLHVLHDGGFEGAEVFYSVWSPSPDSGFITEYEWIIEGVDTGGVILVDGNKVHVVVQDSLVHDYMYLQYDLAGNTVVPLTDFTTEYLVCQRYPELQVDSDGNPMVVAKISGEYLYWKLDKNTGTTLIDQNSLVSSELPEMAPSKDFIVRQIPGSDQFYLCWTDGYLEHRVFNLVFDSDGNIIVDWHIAYDYIDEDPEDVKNIDGVVDDHGNLYIIYAQVETEPQIDYFPTFGWFDHSYLGIDDTAGSLPEVECITLSQNPVQGGVQFSLSTSETVVLKIFDLMGREVSSVEISDGTGFWNGTGYSGERLPAGVYTVVCDPGISQRFSLLN
ncbi:MAG: hypothetical protein J7K88_10060 [Candidatus Fermentibacteraceae bacterium]|nr:hypothetical protein [Candidatus Fermentibacteraceae bacterium]